MLKVILKGLIYRQTIFRALFEFALTQQSPSQGIVIDLGGVKQPVPGYVKAMRVDMTNMKTINLSTKVGADLIVDAAYTGLPEQSANEVWAFNLLEHVEYPERILIEAQRLLKPQGRFIGVIPFLLGIHGEPDDFVRYSKSKLQGVFRDTGFVDCEIIPIGIGPFTAGFSQVQPLLPRIITIPTMLCIFPLDKIIFFLRPHWKDKWPLGYLMTARAN